MKSVQDWVNQLQLEAHPEGGYFKVTSANERTITSNTGLQVPLFTSIYFLLEDKNPSRFHRIASNELWYYHGGEPLTVHMIHQDGRYESVDVGPDPDKGHVFSFEVPKGVIFGSSVTSGFAIVSCMVSPGFDFKEFELFSYKELVEKYPEHEEIIKKLT